MSECNNKCSSCAVDCADRKAENLLINHHPESTIGKVIGVISGKGGVGKSLTTSLLAVSLRKKGYRVGILDADITGPSIGKIFGITEKAKGSEDRIFPHQTKTGIEVISVNMLLENDETPVLWRGPVIAGMVKQFYSDVIWKDIDYLLVDMPPGTGDVALTVFQSLPLDGVVMVTSPQDLVKMVVAKAINMAKMMNIPIVGIVENMSYMKCDDCDKVLYPFGKSKIKEVAQEYNLEVLAQMPINPELATLCDQGALEDVTVNALDEALEKIESVFSK